MNKPLNESHFSLNPTVALTEQQQAEIAALKAMPDEAVDYSDIPPLTEEFWQNAVRNPYYKPTKTATTVRVDTDVLLWLKSKGKGYQARMNAMLRAEMLKELERQHH
ncbi:MAG: BrnA antitoxin family protein [Methylococcaceae bacterium]